METNELVQSVLDCTSKEQEIKNIVDVLLKEGLNEEYEITAILSSPSLIITHKDGKVTGLENYPEHLLLASLLIDIGVDMAIVVYVVGDEFFVKDVWLDKEQRMMTPTQRGAFMEFFNANRSTYRLKHVPVSGTVLTLLGAKAALISGVEYETVKQDLLTDVQILVDSPMLLHSDYEGMLFRSLTTEKKFYCRTRKEG